MTRPYRHVFFDLDHTLWDFETNSRETLTELYTDFGLEKFGLFDVIAFRQQFSSINHSLWDEFNKGLIDKAGLRRRRFLETFTGLGLDEKHHPVGISAQYIERCSGRSAVFPYVHEVLGELAQTCTLSIITNGFPEAQDRKLSNSGLKPYFKQVIISELVGYAKPHPEIFHIALRALDAQPGEAVMVGDNCDTDIAGACAAGITAVWFNPLGEKRTHQADHEIACISELRPILLSTNSDIRQEAKVI